MYDVDDARYKYLAVNGDGSMCTFHNAPVRDFNLCIWVDSVTGDPGDFQPYLSWDQSARELSVAKDMRASKLKAKRG